MFEQTCRNCKYYEHIEGTRRQGYCRNPMSHYADLKRNGGNRGADRCFVRKEDAKNGNA